MDHAKEFEQCSREIIRKIKRDRKSEFVEIVQHKRDQLLDVAAVIVESRSDAEDVVQNALLKAYHALGYFRGNSQIFTWIYRIVINEAKNKYSSNKRDACRGEFDKILNIASVIEVDSAGVSENYLPYYYLCKQELYRLMLKVVWRLPKNMRITVYLRFFKEHTYEEIACKLNCSIGTVKSRLARARSLLKKYLLEYQSDITGRYFNG